MVKKINLDNVNYDTLKTLDEDSLRKQIIIPLLTYIGGQNVMDKHGAGEKGIDVYFEMDDIFSHRRRFGVQVKSVDINFQSKANKGNILTISNQIKMAFSKKQIFGTSDKGKDGNYIDGFYVVTSKKVNQTAAEYIYGNRDYSYVHIIDGGELMEIIKKKEFLKRKNSCGNPGFLI